MNKVIPTILFLFCSSALGDYTEVRSIERGGTSASTASQALINLGAASLAQIQAKPGLDFWVSPSVGNDSYPGSEVLKLATVGAAIANCNTAGATESSPCAIHLDAEYYPFCGTLTPAIIIEGQQTVWQFSDKGSHIYCDVGGTATPISVNFGSAGGDIYIRSLDDFDPSGNGSGFSVTSQLSTTNGYSELDFSEAAIQGPITWSGVGANNDFLEIMDGSSIRGGGTIDSVGVDLVRSNMRGTWNYGDTAGNGGTYLSSLFGNLQNSTQNLTSTTGNSPVLIQNGFSTNSTVNLSGSGASIYYNSNEGKPGTLTLSNGATDGSPQTVIAYGGTATITGSPYPGLQINDTSGNNQGEITFENNGSVSYYLGANTGQQFYLYDQVTGTTAWYLDDTDDTILANGSASNAVALSVVNQGGDGTTLQVSSNGAANLGYSQPVLNVVGPLNNTMGIYDTGSYGGMGIAWNGGPVWYVDGNNDGEIVFPNAGLEINIAAPLITTNTATFGGYTLLTGTSSSGLAMAGSTAFGAGLTGSQGYLYFDSTSNLFMVKQSPNGDGGANYYPMALDKNQQTMGSGTWDGSTPTGETPLYQWDQQGKHVTLMTNIAYSTSGSSNTTVTFVLPSDLPTPYAWSNAAIYYGAGQISASSSGPDSSVGKCFISYNGTNWILTITNPTALNAAAAFCTVDYITP